MPIYANRKQAGQVLSEALLAYQHQKNVIVLALPRGGVPVAFEVSERLDLDLDVFIVRKLGLPGYSELAMGAIAQGGTVILNKNVVLNYKITADELQAVTDRERQELARRLKVYRGNRPPLVIKGKTVILIDDGIATGATMKTAVDAIRAEHPTRLIAAVPVADKQVTAEFNALVDEFICPMQVDSLEAVGNWYDDFQQTSDEEVIELLTN